MRMWRFSKTNGITQGLHTKMEVIQRRLVGLEGFEPPTKGLERSKACAGETCFFADSIPFLSLKAEVRAARHARMQPSARNRVHPQNQCVWPKDLWRVRRFRRNIIAPAEQRLDGKDPDGDHPPTQPKQHTVIDNAVPGLRCVMDEYDQSDNAARE